MIVGSKSCSPSAYKSNSARLFGLLAVTERTLHTIPQPAVTAGVQAIGGLCRKIKVAAITPCVAAVLLCTSSFAATAGGAENQAVTQKGVPASQWIVGTPPVFADAPMQWYLYRFLPPLNSSVQQKYPLVIYKPGWGLEGVDNMKQIDGSPWFVDVFTSPSARVQYPAFLLALQTRNDNAKGVGGPGGDVDVNPLQFNAIIDDFIAKNPAVDTNRIYLVGESWGGRLAWMAALNRPNFFAALVPCCGSYQPLSGDMTSYTYNVPQINKPY